MPQVLLHSTALCSASPCDRTKAFGSTKKTRDTACNAANVCRTEKADNVWQRQQQMPRHGKHAIHMTKKHLDHQLHICGCRDKQPPT